MVMWLNTALTVDHRLDWYERIYYLSQLHAALGGKAMSKIANSPKAESLLQKCFEEEENHTSQTNQYLVCYN